MVMHTVEILMFAGNVTSVITDSLCSVQYESK